MDSLLASQLERFRNTPPYAVRFVLVQQIVGEDGKPSGAGGGPFVSESRSRGEVRERGGQYELILDSYVPEDRKKTDLLVQRSHYVWSENRLLQTTSSFARDGKVDGTNASLQKQNKIQTGYRPNMDGRFADGVLLDSEHFSLLLQRAPDRAGFEEESLTRIEGTTRWGRLVVWLSKTEPPRFERASFAATPPKDAPENEAYSFDVRVESYQDIDGVPFALEATRVDSIQSGSPLPVRIRYRLERWDYRVSPDFESIDAFRFDLPQGTEVEVEDGRGVVFEWRDGGIKPRIPNELDERISKIAMEHRNETMDTKTIAALSLPSMQTDIHAISSLESKTVLPRSDRSKNSRLFGILPLSALVAGGLVVVLAILLGKKGSKR